MISISLKKRRSMRNKCSTNILGPNHSPRQHNHFPKVIEVLFCKVKKESILGRCKQGGSKVAKVVVPKVHINGKFNIRLENNNNNQC